MLNPSIKLLRKVPVSMTDTVVGEGGSECTEEGLSSVDTPFPVQTRKNSHTYLSEKYMNWVKALAVSVLRPNKILKGV